MASSRDFLEFVLEQLSSLSDITYRAMMGEFILYYKGKIVGGIYDNRLLIKPSPSALRMLPDASMETPYDGGTNMLMVEDVEDRDLLIRLFNAMYPELPEPTKKKKQNVR